MIGFSFLCPRIGLREDKIRELAGKLTRNVKRHLAEDGGEEDQDRARQALSHVVSNVVRNLMSKYRSQSILVFAER